MLKRIDEKSVQSTYLNFIDQGVVSVGSTTHVYSVTLRGKGILIGYIRWHNQWRRYCFHPLNCILEHGSLRDIADFIEETSVAYKIKRNWPKKYIKPTKQQIKDLIWGKNEESAKESVPGV